MRVVVGFQPGPGHASRLGAIAGALHARGHHVTLASSASWQARTGRRPPHAYLAVGPDWIEDEGSQTGPRERAARIVETFFSGAEQVAADLVRAFPSAAPDLFVFDHTLLGGPIAAETLSVPWAAVYGLTVPFRPAGWPPFGGAFPFEGTLRSRFRYAWMERFIRRENRELFAPVLRAWRRIGRRVRDPWDPYAERARLGIVGSIPECDFPRPASFPANVRYAGPLFDAGAPEADDGALDELLAPGPTPRIHVTFGWTFSRAPEVLATVLDALRPESWRVLVATGHLTPQTESREAMRIVSAVPHTRVFPRLDAVVCHAGANTLMKALFFGVPAVMIPLGAEQRSNASRFERAGMGIAILPDRLDRESVRAAVSDLLQPGRRERAKELSRLARAAGGAAEAAAWLEAALQVESPSKRVDVG